MDLKCLASCLLCSSFVLFTVFSHFYSLYIWSIYFSPVVVAAVLSLSHSSCVFCSTETLRASGLLRRKWKTQCPRSRWALDMTRWAMVNLAKHTSRRLNIHERYQCMIVQKWSECREAGGWRCSSSRCWKHPGKAPKTVAEGGETLESVFNY